MYCTACGKKIDNDSTVCIHCGSPTKNFNLYAPSYESAIKAERKIQALSGEQEYIDCPVCHSQIADGARKCLYCKAALVYSGCSFWDNWPAILSACFLAGAVYLFSLGRVGLCIFLAVVGAAFAALRFLLPIIRAKNKTVIKRKPDFHLWMLLYLIPALLMAYALADIGIKYR